MTKRGDYGREGAFSRDGMANTLCWAAPKEEIAAILMTNIIPNCLYPSGQEMHRFVYEVLEAGAAE